MSPFLQIPYHWNDQKKSKRIRSKKKDFTPTIIDFGSVQFHLGTLVFVLE